jgi:NAD(P)H-dependent FMN reductase
MRLAVFNGSPRGKNSNTKRLLDEFRRGFLEENNNTLDIFYLKSEKLIDEHIAAFEAADHVILAFPLYTDAMPGIVKGFIEGLQQFCRRQSNPTLGFIVQSGFPEAIHTQYVHLYLKKLCKRLGCKYTGTARRGGVEGIRYGSAKAGRKLFKMFYDLGRAYSSTGEFDRVICKKLVSPTVFPTWVVAILRVLNRLGLLDIMWNRELKKNKAYDRRFCTPYCDN